MLTEYAFLLTLGLASTPLSPQKSSPVQGASYQESSLGRIARLPATFSDVAEHSIRGVVNIRTTSMGHKGHPGLDLSRYFQGQSSRESDVDQSIGSGVVLNPNGYIITNFHVIEGADAIDVLFAQKKKRFRAKVVGIDPKTDLAVLKVNVNFPLTPLDFANSNGLRVGDIVLAVGNPFGYSHTVTSGIISAKGRVVGAGPYDQFLQTDAAINPGNSGGPLIDTRGRVVGINTAVSVEGRGIGFAIPSNLAHSVAKDLIKYGKVKRPWIGIIGQDLLSVDELEGGITTSKDLHGVVITSLAAEGPAHRGGLKIGDLIVGFDEVRVNDVHQFQELINSKKFGETVDVKIYRRGKKGYMQTRVKLEETPRPEELPPEKDLF